MKPERKMHYKGDGIYQLVYTEKAGALTMQFATMNWNPQFTVIGLELPLNQAKSLKKVEWIKILKSSFLLMGNMFGRYTLRLISRQ